MSWGYRSNARLPRSPLQPLDHSLFDRVSSLARNPVCMGIAAIDFCVVAGLGFDRGLSGIYKMMFPKQKAWRNDAYKKWVETLPCSICTVTPCGDCHHLKWRGRHERNGYHCARLGFYAFMPRVPRANARAPRAVDGPMGIHRKDIRPGNQ